MTTNRDSVFPATSIGRTGGARIPRATSQEPESVNGHPLLGSTDPDSVPKYVPYTPRQRNSTPNIAVQSSAPVITVPQSGDVTSKLRLTTLKAAAQAIGVQPGSFGWNFLEKLATEPGAEWAEIWNVLTVNKATLLLPLENPFGAENVDISFARDHIAICASDSREHAPVITLSGLRGILIKETLIFRSSVPPSSPQFENMLNPTTRETALSNLAPIPDVAFPHSYPTFSVPKFCHELPFPPRASLVNSSLHLNRPVSQNSGNRLSLASLFGKNTPQGTPPRLESPAVSIGLVDDSSQHLNLSAFTIDRRIVLEEIGRAVNKAIRNEVTTSLSSVPPWVVNRVHEFTVDFYPLLKVVKGNGAHFVNLRQESMDNVVDRFQNFYMSLDQDLRLTTRPIKLSSKRQSSEFTLDDEEKNRTRTPPEVVSIIPPEDAKIREIIEAVEASVCSLFYDRIFRQPTSDDSSHDEALASRISALNAVNITLEHLDVVIGDGAEQVDALVKECGEVLGQLDVGCKSPSEKVAVMIAAHKIIVDGLSRLPPIRLRAEDEPRKKPTSTPLVDRLANVARASSATASPASTSIEIAPEVTPQIVQVDSATHQTAGIPILTPEIPAELDTPQILTKNTSSSPTAPSVVSTPVSGDVLLPLIIYSVVVTNPPRLVSHLLYTQRFRNQSIGGEESYCLVNLLAVCEFLENVDLAALGFKDFEAVTSAATLTPILSELSPRIASASPSAALTGVADPSSGANLRGRVEQQVDALAGSATKVLSGVTGVVDTSFGILRALLPNSPGTLLTGSVGTSASTVLGNTTTPVGFGRLRREGGFNLPFSMARAKSTPFLEETGRPLVAVSRPESFKTYGHAPTYGNSDEDNDETEGVREEEDNTDRNTPVSVGVGHVEEKSIQSFESMPGGKGDITSEVQFRKASMTGSHRLTLTDRLANMSGLPRRGDNDLDATSAKGTPPHNRRHPASTTSSRDVSPTRALTFRHLPPPNQRFLECSEDELRLGEVRQLLVDYRTLVEAVRVAGGFSA